MDGLSSTAQLPSNQFHLERAHSCAVRPSARACIAAAGSALAGRQDRAEARRAAKLAATAQEFRAAPGARHAASQARVGRPHALLRLQRLLRLLLRLIVRARIHASSGAMRPQGLWNSSA
jgi:hypothetical protein